MTSPAVKLIALDKGPVPPELAPFVNDAETARAVADKYPVVVNDYWLSLAKRDKARDGSMASDPILAQALPDVRELTEILPGDCPDPFEELSEASPMPGLVHRFPDRVLVVVSDACAMRCRHCTRKNLLGTHFVPGDADIARMRDYVAARPAIREVLLSGGDPLMLGDETLAARVETFASLPQIYSVRIGTRIPCTYPLRVTDALAARLGKSRKVWVNTQFNHPREITLEATRACALLVDAGIPVSCQTVLLKGVNDDPDTLEALFRGLQAIRMRPYYAFAGDPVSGTAHFRVSRERAAELEREVATRIGGLALPRFVADIPRAPRKTPC